MGFIPSVKTLWENDARAKASGEPTKYFHNVKPNPNHPEIAAIYKTRQGSGGTLLNPLSTKNGNSMYDKKLLGG